MKSPGHIWYVALILALGVAIAGCGGGGQSSGSPKSITFWSAPNPPQQVFWTNMAKAYMAQHSDVQITVRAIPESPTSEAGIQAALAGGEGPTASENVFTGFAGQLLNSRAIVPLDQMPGWNDLLKVRNMEQTIQGWKFADGHYYVLPMYTNAMLFGWRMDILKQIGYNTPPRTYSQVIAMGEKLNKKSP